MKIKKQFHLNEQSIEYIKQIQKQYSLNSNSAALEKIISAYKNIDQNQADLISNAVIEKLNKILTRIRLGTNNADKNSDIILLMLNQLMLYSNNKEYINENSNQLIKSKQIIQDKIHGYVTKKRERETSTSKLNTQIDENIQII